MAQAEVERARNDEAEFAKSLKAIEARLATQYPAVPPWDVRAGLAVVLAEAKQQKLSPEQLRVCVAEADVRKLRSLTPGAVYRLLVSSRGFEIPLEPRLREGALDLVPAELRERVK